MIQIDVPNSAARFVFALVCLAMVGCSPSTDTKADAFVPAPPLGFVHDNGFRGEYHFPETFGSGVALLDVNRDGVLDLYAVQSGTLPNGSTSDESAERTGEPANQLFLGAPGGVLTRANAGPARDHAYGMGAIVGDINGDQHPDLFVTNLGPDRLFLGTGDEAAWFRAGADAELNGPQAANWSSAAGLADLNRDGHLDLVIVSYNAWSLDAPHNCPGPDGADYCDVKEYPGAHDRMFLGDGQGGFREATNAWGLDTREGRGLGLALVDFDVDGDVDLYIANDTDPNAYWQNEAGERFLDRTTLSGASANMDGRFEAGMGVAVADVSGDGLADILVTNFSAEPHALYINRERGRFRESSRSAGIAAASLPKLSFGAAFADFDADGWQDVFTASGHVLRNAAARTRTWSWKQSDLLLMGTGPATFEEREPGTLFGTPRVGRGLAEGDLNGDGRPDLAVTHSGDELRIGWNAMPQRGTFWGATLRDLRPATSNTMAIGSQVQLTLDDGRLLTRWVRSGTSYLSQDDQRVLFGIPDGHSIQRVVVRWPDGESDEFPALCGQLGAWHRIDRP